MRGLEGARPQHGRWQQEGPPPPFPADELPDVFEVIGELPAAAPRSSRGSSLRQEHLHQQDSRGEGSAVLDEHSAIALVAAAQQRGHPFPEEEEEEEMRQDPTQGADGPAWLQRHVPWEAPNAGGAAGGEAPAWPLGLYGPALTPQAPDTAAPPLWHHAPPFPHQELEDSDDDSLYAAATGAASTRAPASPPPGAAHVAQTPWQAAGASDAAPSVPEAQAGDPWAALRLHASAAREYEDSSSEDSAAPYSASTVAPSLPSSPAQVGAHDQHVGLVHGQATSPDWLVPLQRGLREGGGRASRPTISAGDEHEDHGLASPSQAPRSPASGRQSIASSGHRPSIAGIRPQGVGNDIPVDLPPALRSQERPRRSPPLGGAGADTGAGVGGIDLTAGPGASGTGSGSVPGLRAAEGPQGSQPSKPNGIGGRFLSWRERFSDRRPQLPALRASASALGSATEGDEGAGRARGDTEHSMSFPKVSEGAQDQRTTTLRPIKAKKGEGRRVRFAEARNKASGAAARAKRSCSCQGRRMLCSSVALAVSIFALGLPCLIVQVVYTPRLVEGIFGYVTQAPLVSNRAPSFAAHFLRARGRAVTALSAAAEEGALRAANASYVWRRLEVIYYYKVDSVVSDVNIGKIRDIEADLRALPGWRPLCTSGPATYQYLCDPGDSLASIAFGRESTVGSPDGVRSTITFDGKGSRTIMDMGTVLGHVAETSPDSLLRWLPTRWSGGDSWALRSIFDFRLPEATGPAAWDAFLHDQLAPHLRALVEQQYQMNQKDNHNLRIEFRAAGLQGYSRFYLFFDSTPPRTVAIVGSVLVTALVTRRIILMLVSLLLAAAAPWLASAMAADPSEERGFSEVPVAAIVGWCAAAASCAEVAVACTRAWARHQYMRRERLEAKQRRQAMVGASSDALTANKGAITKVFEVLSNAWFRFGGDFAMHALGPPLGTACCVFSVGAVMWQLPLAGELLLHTGLGLLGCIVFGALLLPLSIEVSDQVAKRAAKRGLPKRLNLDSGMRRYVLPLECGIKWSERKFRRRCSSVIVTWMGSKWACSAFIVANLASMGAFVALSQNVQFRAVTPEIFPKGNPIEDAPQVWASFESPPSAAYTAKVAQRRAVTCTPEAHDSAGCTWHRCEVDTATPGAGAAAVASGMCRCSALRRDQDSGQAAAGGACTGARGRVFGISGMASQTAAKLWSKVQAQYPDLALDLSQDPWLQRGVPLEVEDWSSGDVFMEPQVSTYVPTNASAGGQAPSAWEDSCLQVICYCQRGQCVLPATFTSVGSISIPQNPTSDDGDTWVPMANRTTYETTFVYLVWGLEAPKFMPHWAIDGLPLVFHDQLRIEEPWAQRQLLSFCEGWAPELDVLSYVCFASDFKAWLLSIGARFPATAQEFPSRFADFAAWQAAQGRSVGRYFWLDEAGRVAGTFANFTVRKPAPEDAVGYMQRWVDYKDWRNKASAAPRGSTCIAATGEAWFVSPLLAEAAENLAVKDVIRKSTYVVPLVAGFAALVLTLSPIIAMAVIGSLGLVILPAGAVALAMRGQEMTVLDAVACCVFLLGLTTPTLRVAQQYAESKQGPGPNPSPETDLFAADPRLKQKNRLRSMSMHGLDGAAALATRLAQKRPDRSPLWPGAIDAERRARTAAALRRTSAAIFSGAAACATSGAACMWVQGEALKQVAIAFFFACVATPLTASLLMPMLLLAGFGPSRVWGVAFVKFVRWRLQVFLLSGYWREVGSRWRAFWRWLIPPEMWACLAFVGGIIVMLFWKAWKIFVPGEAKALLRKIHRKWQNTAPARRQLWRNLMPADVRLGLNVLASNLTHSISLGGEMSISTGSSGEYTSVDTIKSLHREEIRKDGVIAAQVLGWPFTRVLQEGGGAPEPLRQGSSDMQIGETSTGGRRV